MQFQRSNLIKVIYRPADTIEGHIVCNMLIAQGIDAVLLGEYQQGGVGELMPADFASINVPEEQVPAAEAVMQQYLRDSSTTTKADQTTNNFFLTLMFLLILFVSISIFFKLLFSV